MFVIHLIVTLCLSVKFIKFASVVCKVIAQRRFNTQFGHWPDFGFDLSQMTQLYAHIRRHSDATLYEVSTNSL